jgi:L-alanine-DL-glutamate epimerase-like enolase superfamily enzyme
MVLVRAHTSDGVVGLGEAVPLSLRGGHSLEQVAAELRQFAIDFGDATDSERRLFFVEKLELSPPSRCALSTAWDDLLGKRFELPAWKVLGAEGSSPIRCNATLSVGNPDQVADEARHWADEGFRTFKLKLGLTNDVEQVEAVRAAVGPEAKLRVDVNGAWGPAEALAKLERMSEFELELVEQPCATLEELAEVRRGVEVPIVADESVANWVQAGEARESEACDYATLKLSKVGGSQAAKGIAAVLPSYLSSALDGPVGIAAAAHTAQAFYARTTMPDHDPSEPGDPGVAHGLATQRLFAETIAARGCELRDGFLHLPEGPGLGVEIDDAALERHRL